MNLAGCIQSMELQESAMTEQLSTYTQKPCLKTVHKIPENLTTDSCEPGNINNLRYADNTTLTAESEEELKNLLMMVKEESEKAGIKQHSKNEEHSIQSYHFTPNSWGES